MDPVASPWLYLLSSDPGGLCPKSEALPALVPPLAPCSLSPGDRSHMDTLQERASASKLPWTLKENAAQSL